MGIFFVFRNENKLLEKGKEKNCSEKRSIYEPFVLRCRYPCRIIVVAAFIAFVSANYALRYRVRENKDYNVRGGGEEEADEQRIIIKYYIHVMENLFGASGSVALTRRRPRNDSDLTWVRVVAYAHHAYGHFSSLLNISKPTRVHIASLE